MSPPRKRKSTTHLTSSTEPDSSTQPSSPTTTFNHLLKPTKHTLETLPESTVLVHSTNCLGEWGAGVAKAIAEIWPVANDVYAAHCESAEKGQLEGTCLLIAPQQEDGTGPTKPPKTWIACLFTSYGYGRPTKKKAGKDSKAKIVAYTGQALLDLRKQLDDFQEQQMEKTGSVEVAADRVDRDDEGKSRKRRKKRWTGGDEDAEKDEDSEIKIQGQAGSGDVADAKEKRQSLSMKVYSPRFNSGSFGVPWDQTSAAIIDVFDDWNGEWFVLSPH